MNFEWDDGNLTKLKRIQDSGRFIEQQEIESVFADGHQLITQTYSDEQTGEERYMIRGLSNQNRVLSDLFVIRQPGDRIRVLNAWKTKQAKLKEYHANKTE
ncbi:hypothetical protein M0L20_28500 [Spirosoma sp. RP8]|uniref:BrnT family toxin n=1 Tax=Spirosoma liriopis TaxID=2937440 RepID=A0ABT0HUH4_9BACT|nr:hypothetical protein [Spirosoma liriopis]MCK8495840.1 hypothetical protein [Spirosoma liriopis]